VLLIRAMQGFLAIIYLMSFRPVFARLRGTATAGPAPVEAKAVFAEGGVSPFASGIPQQLEQSTATTSPFAGMPRKRIEEWEAHAYDHPSKISTMERVLNNETTAHLAPRDESQGCYDDPKWRDADGDGCEIYKFVIESGKTTREIACSGGGVQSAPPQLRGRASKVEVVTDATAKIYCPVTCGAC